MISDDLTYEQAEAILEQMAGAGLMDFPEFGSLANALAEAETQSSPPPTLPPVRPDFARPIWNERAFQSLVESIPDALVIIDSDNAMVLVNAEAEKVFGYRREELLGRNIEVLLPERFRNQALGYFWRSFTQPNFQGMRHGLELYGLRKDGREFPVEIGLNPLETEQGFLITSTIRDITDRRRLEARYRTLVEGIPAVTFMAALDEGQNELYVSPQIEDLLGFSQQEWLEDPVLWYAQLHPEDRERWHTEFAHTCALGTPFRSVYRFIARDGRTVWVQGEAKLVRDGAGRPLFIQGMAFDISERKRAEETLRHAHDELENLVRQRTTELARTNKDLEIEVAQRTASQELLASALAEKESLLKEIHHRVKNNLQVISSLLNLQSATIKDAQTLQAFRESQNRVKSMALIHEKLYQSKNLARIDFGPYIRELTFHLLRTYGVRASEVTLQIDVSEASLALDAAIPCGLIVTELVSNCLKHAFPTKRVGKIVISLESDGCGKWTLIVSDNGIGLPKDLDPHNTESLGLQLVETLTDQLQGTCRFRSVAGTHFELSFSEPQSK